VPGVLAATLEIAQPEVAQPVASSRVSASAGRRDLIGGSSTAAWASG